ncbi:DNA primase [compost metagenome]
MTAPIDLVLSRLDKVKAAGAGKWKACCPAHDDRDPSLSIREADDGKVLLHCWAGCFTADVLAAIGLTVRDLFPVDSTGQVRHGPVRRGPSKAAQQLEATVISIAVEHLRQGKQLSAADRERYETAKRRLGVA